MLFLYQLFLIALVCSKYVWCRCNLEGKKIFKVRKRGKHLKNTLNKTNLVFSCFFLINCVFLMSLWTFLNKLFVEEKLRRKIRLASFDQYVWSNSRTIQLLIIWRVWFNKWSYHFHNSWRRTFRKQKRLLYDFYCLI